MNIMNTTDTTTENDNTPSAFKPKFNRAAMKRHLKLCSHNTRNGKFTRVSDETLTDIEAYAEAAIRTLRRPDNPMIGLHEPIIPCGMFLTREGKESLIEAFNWYIARKMQRVVYDTRTGKTL